MKDVKGFTLDELAVEVDRMAGFVPKQFEVAQAVLVAAAGAVRELAAIRKSTKHQRLTGLGPFARSLMPPSLTQTQAQPLEAIRSKSGAIALPLFLLDPLRAQVFGLMDSRPADRIIGSEADPYMHRWHLIERNRDGNAYAHRFFRSDDDRAHHDHPWESCSIVLFGRYIEHTIAAGGIHSRVMRNAGDVIFRGARDAHRVEVIAGEVAPVTLFLTGAVIRDWGFHCSDRGWVHWRDFTNPADGGATIGRGCDAA